MTSNGQASKSSPGVLTFEHPTVRVLEGSVTARIPVIRVNGSYSPISVRYRVLDDAASPYAKLRGQLFFPNGILKQEIDIPLIDDDVRGLDLNLKVELFEPSLKTDVVDGLCVLTIIDDDMIPGYLELERPQLRVSEDIGSLEVKVLRREGHDGQIRMRYKTTPVTAQPNSDFTPILGELVFEEGEEIKILKVDILDDTIRESLETFRIELFDPSVGTGVLNFRNRGSILTTDVTIEDNDMIPGYLELERPQLRVSEDIGSLEVKVLRREGHDGQLRIRYQTTPVTAQPNSDFTPVRGELIFDDREDMKILKVDILDDTLRESPEQFRLELFDPSVGIGVLNFRHRGSIMTTDITIEDNDMIPGYLELERPQLRVSEDIGSLEVKVLRREGHDGQIRMSYRTTPVTAQPNSDFTPILGELVFEEGEEMKILKVDILDDTIRESPEEFRLELFDPSVGIGVLNFRHRGSIMTTDITIEDNDMMPGIVEIEKPIYNVLENVGVVEIGVIRLDGTDGEIRVGYETQNQTARPEKDFKPAKGELIFGEGEIRKTILVPIVDDDEREPMQQFEVHLLDPTPGPGVINFKGLGSTRGAVVIIKDDDMKPGFFELEQPSYVVPEDSGTVQVGVVRVGGSDGEIHVRYQTRSNTALAEQDFIPTTGELIFREGEVRKDIIINILDDEMRESSETFEVQLLDPTPAPGVLNFRQFESKLTTVVTITDNDSKKFFPINFNW
ncbi:adhesion G-protein coupled receptor V1 [Trichonephila clavata]|uniref:Adhesion G-protein coupled receptor V1 n=1 Tax=Trichonephila clavata TaxID=2740835 RepID=A0A8X6FJ63_TRICU|nr:adhesion G-protein coupled receptor V1 [Trichonephila clavata]